MPDDVLETLRNAFAEVANDPAFAERALATGTALTYQPAEAFGEVWQRDWENYAPMLQN